MFELNSITNDQFIQALFEDKAPLCQVASFPDDPGKIPQGEGGRCWVTHLYNPAYPLPEGDNAYYVISTFKPGQDKDGNPKVQRRKALHDTTVLFVLDDVKEKLDEEQVKRLPDPSYILVTSEGSEHWGYKVDQSPFAPYTVDQVETLQKGLIKSELCPSGRDPGLFGVTRFVRLPGGWNTKARNVSANSPRGFKCYLSLWNPTHTVTLESLAAPFNIDINAPVTGNGNGVGSDDANHPVLLAMSEAGSIKHKHPDKVGVYEVTCPYVHEHTGGQDDGTSIKLFEDGKANLYCHHSCLDFHTHADFKAYYRGLPGWHEAQSAFNAARDDANANAFDGFAGVGPSGGQSFLGDPVKEARIDDAVVDHIIKRAESAIIRFYRDASGPSLCDFRPEIFREAYPQAFYSAHNAKTHFFNGKGDLVYGPDNKINGYITELFGPVLDQSALSHFAETRPDILAADVGNCVKQVFRAFTELVELNHQRSEVAYSVDIYADKPRVEIKPDFAEVIRVHKDFVPAVEVDQWLEDAVYSDYKEHFPEFDDFLTQLASARFASNARRAYTWLQAPSSWGKTFLMHGVLGPKGLGMVVDISVKEIEKVFSGDPIGKKAQDFLNAWVVFVDEARVITGDIKQLDSYISGSPKNQLSFRANVYNKVFCSASSIDSFSGEAGVEMQFGNRFSYLNPDSECGIDERELFQSLGADVYRNALTSYVARFFNSFVARRRLEGQAKATKRCDDWLNKYHGDHRVDHALGSLEDTFRDYEVDIATLAEQVSGPELYIHEGAGSEVAELWCPANVIRAQHADYGEVILIRKASKLIKAWLKDQVDRSEVYKVSSEGASVLINKMNLVKSHAGGVRLLINGAYSQHRGVIIKAKATED